MTIKECNLKIVKRIMHYCKAIAFRGGLVVQEEADSMVDAVAEIEARRLAMGGSSSRSNSSSKSSSSGSGSRNSAGSDDA